MVQLQVHQDVPRNVYWAGLDFLGTRGRTATFRQKLLINTGHQNSLRLFDGRRNSVLPHSGPVYPSVASAAAALIKKIAADVIVNYGNAP